MSDQLRAAAQEALKFLKDIRPMARMVDPSEVSDALREALAQPSDEFKRGFLEGFAVSGEGFNGEYPFNADKKSIANDKYFQEELADVLKDCPK